MKKYNLEIYMIDGRVVKTHNIKDSDRADLSKLSYEKPFLLDEDDNGVEIMVNLNHVVTMQWTKIKKEKAKKCCSLIESKTKTKEE